MPENTAPMASEPQLQYILKLAHPATGDGRAHLEALKASCGGALTVAQASAEIKRLKALPAGARPAAAPKKLQVLTTEAPPGRYAVELPGARGSSLVELSKPTSGKWNGYTFVKTVPIFEGGEPQPIKGEMAVLAIREIDANPLGTAAIYGVITGRCGQCNRRLSDASSIAMGIGPECMMRFAHLPDRFSGTAAQ
jgi:hypothetical protein